MFRRLSTPERQISRLLEQSSDLRGLIVVVIGRALQEEVPAERCRARAIRDRAIADTRWVASRRYAVGLRVRREFHSDLDVVVSYVERSLERVRCGRGANSGDRVRARGQGPTGRACVSCDVPLFSQRRAVVGTAGERHSAGRHGFAVEQDDDVHVARVRSRHLSVADIRAARGGESTHDRHKPGGPSAAHHAGQPSPASCPPGSRVDAEHVGATRAIASPHDLRERRNTRHRTRKA
jgi:hypothetical protein